MELTAETRRNEILQYLKNASGATSASSLARMFNVSRQIIVGDIALLRASGHAILATPKGYVYETENGTDFEFIEMIACSHNSQEMRDELYTIVDNGATAIDVTVEHPVYGQISGNLSLSSRYDVDNFISKFESDVVPISVLTGGAHLHRIGAHSKDVIDRIVAKLDELNIIIK